MINTPDIAYTDSMPVDSSEMAPIANLMIMGTNGFLDFLNMVLSIVAIFIIAVILLVPWRLIAIRKHSVIAEVEKKIAKYLLKKIFVNELKYYAYCPCKSCVNTMIVLR